MNSDNTTLSLKPLPSQTSLLDQVAKSIPLSVQNEKMRTQAVLTVINENEADENILNSSDYAAIPIPDKSKHENNLAVLDYNIADIDQQPRQGSPEHSIKFRYIESKPCGDDPSNLTVENSIINENDQESVQTRIEHNSISPNVQLNNELISQNHPQPQNNNPNEPVLVNNAINDPVADSAPQPDANIPNTPPREASEHALMLRGVCRFSLFLAIGYLIILLINQGLTNTFPEVILVWVYYLFKIYRYYRRPYKNEDIDIQRRLKRFIICDWTSILIYSIGFTLKVAYPTRIQSSVILMPFCSFGILNLIIYYYVQRAPPGIHRTQKIIALIDGILVWTQIMLMSLKIDGTLKTSWSHTLLIAIIYIGSMIVSSLFTLFMFLLKIFSLLCRPSLSNKVTVIGYGWYFLLSLFSSFWMIILVGIIRRLDKNPKREMLFAGIIASEVHLVILIGFTLVFNKPLLSFLSNLHSRDTNVRNIARGQSGDYNIKFEVTEPKIPYLMMISSTFHQVLQQEMKTYSQEQLKEWRRRISKMKAQKGMIAKERSRSGNNKEESPQENVKEIKRLTSSANAITSDDNRSLLSENYYPRHYSHEDVDTYKLVERPIKYDAIKEAEKTCYICVQNTSSAIIIPCGHSGICYECAIESWRKGDKCVMCRQKVENILKTKVLENLNVSKSIHGTKKLFETKIRE